MKSLDCLILGHLQISSDELYSKLCEVGNNSGSFKELNMGVVGYKKKKHSLSQLYNYAVQDSSQDPNSLIKESDTMSATISYLGSFISSHNLTFEAVCSLNDQWDKFIEYIKSYDIGCVIVTTTLYVSPFSIIKIVNKIREINTKTKIVVGGPYISTLFNTQEKECIKYVLSNQIKSDFYINSSQGEKALVQLIKAIKNDTELRSINNLIYFDDGNLVQNDNLEENNKLSENQVDWSLFKDYSAPYVNLRTAISCPFECAFCGFPEHAGKYQYVDVGLIENELNNLVKFNPKVKSIYFIDDTFNVPKERFKSILRMMIRNKYDFKWHSYYRCQFADKETIDLMKESGCEGVFLGIESGSNEILNNMNKKSTVQDYEKGIQLLNKQGIMTFGAFITGFPGENFKSINETINFIKNSGLDFYRTQLWFCERITPIWNERESYKISGEGFDWKHKSMNAKQASSVIEKMFLEIKEVVWLPQYGFDYENVFRLLNQGKNLTQVKEIVSVFNNLVRYKIHNSSTADLTEDQYQNFKQIINN